VLAEASAVLQKVEAENGTGSGDAPMTSERESVMGPSVATAEDRQAEIAKLRADLEAERLKSADLEVELKTASNKTGLRRRAEWTEYHEVKSDPKTVLGKLERLDRNRLMEVAAKALRHIRYKDVVGVVNNLIERAAEDGGMDGGKTGDELYEEFVKVRGYARRDGL